MCSDPKLRKTAVLASIHKEYLDKILSGEKTIEVRTNTPKSILTPFTVFFYETAQGGGARRVLAKALCTGFDILKGTDLTDAGETVLADFLQKSCLTREQVKKYMGTHTTLFGWKLERVKSVDISLEECGVKRPPQSWVYVDIPPGGHSGDFHS